MFGECVYLAGVVTVQVEDGPPSGVQQGRVDAAQGLADEHEAVEDGERRQVVRIGLVTVETRLHDDQRQDVARKTEQEDKRSADLEQPPTPVR